MLEFDILEANRPEAGAVLVLLHGRGSDRRDLLSLRPYLPGTVTLICPDAPFPGSTWGYGPGWAWYRYLGEDRPEEESFHHSLEELDDFLDAVEGEMPEDAGPVVLGGFSQGGTMSLGYALTHPKRIRHAAVFSGFLASVSGVGASKESAGELSVFWGHGRQDPAIPFEFALRGREALREAGARVQEHDYPMMGHGIAPEEVEDFARWIRRIGSGGSGA